MRPVVVENVELRKNLPIPVVGFFPSCQYLPQNHPPPLPHPLPSPPPRPSPTLPPPPLPASFLGKISYWQTVIRRGRVDNALLKTKNIDFILFIFIDNSIIQIDKALNFVYWFRCKKFVLLKKFYSCYQYLCLKIFFHNK
jgi:hypothetical protein